MSCSGCGCRIVHSSVQVVAEKEERRTTCSSVKAVRRRWWARGWTRTTGLRTTPIHQSNVILGRGTPYHSRTKYSVIVVIALLDMANILLICIFFRFWPFVTMKSCSVRLNIWIWIYIYILMFSGPKEWDKLYNVSVLKLLWWCGEFFFVFSINFLNSHFIFFSFRPIHWCCIGQWIYTCHGALLSLEILIFILYLLTCW